MPTGRSKHPPSPPPTRADGTAFHTYHRSIFISDFHIGYKGFDAQAALHFLRAHDCDILYLVGDIVDGWKLRKRWYWTRECCDVIEELVRKRKNGTKIIYIPGNHDDEVRRVSPLRRYNAIRRLGITITNVAIHKTADDRKYVVLHGDQFDTALIRGRLSEWGDRLYLFFTEWTGFSPRPEKIYIEGKPARFSLAKALVRRSKRAALGLMNNLEAAIFRMIRSRHVDGLICGHTHISGIRTRGNRHYINIGAWVGHTNTALVESHAGELTLLSFPDRRMPPRPDNVPLSIQDILKMQHLSLETRWIVSRAAKLWPARTQSAPAIARKRLPPLIASDASPKPRKAPSLKDMSMIEESGPTPAQTVTQPASPPKCPPNASSEYNRRAA